MDIRDKEPPKVVRQRGFTSFVDCICKLREYVNDEDMPRVKYVQMQFKKTVNIHNSAALRRFASVKSSIQKARGN